MTLITNDILEACVMRAALAPSVHNTQPARWARDGDTVTLLCDTGVGLPVADADGRAAALSCGAVLEGMVLALSQYGICATATLTGHDTAPGQGVVALAHLSMAQGPEDPLHKQLEHRFTWRGAFAPDPPNLYGWTRADTRLVLDQPGRAWLADRNDWASFDILQTARFRRELLAWMRLSDTHPRAQRDGLHRVALHLTKAQAHVLPYTMGILWRPLSALGLTKPRLAEARLTQTAPIIAVFHRDAAESPIVSGRAYLRLCLEAANLGFAGWPMTALADHPVTRAELSQGFGLPSDRQLIQVLRFGVPADSARPVRARRPLSEILL